MGKAILFSVLATAMAVSMAMYGTNQGMFEADAELAHYQEKVLAREVALTGLNLAARRVYQDPSFNGNLSGAYGHGQYAVTIQSQAASPGVTAIHIRSTGTIGGQEHVIVSGYEYVVSEQGDQGVPEFMKFGVMSNGDFKLNGNVTVRDDFDPAMNADIHTNGTLRVSGNNLVTGFGTYTNSVLSMPAHNINNTFQPNSNPEGSPVHFQKSAIAVPAFAAEDYKSLATKISTGNLSLSGNYELGTRENPMIWYVEGGLSISGGVSFSGYGVFLTKGDISVSGNVSNLSATATEGNLAFYSEGNISVGSNVTLEAQVFANKNVKVHGGGKLHGGVVGGGTVEPVNFDGSITIYYRQVSEVLTKPFWGGSNGLNLVAYREW